MTPKEIATKLYSDIPLVPTGCLMQSIVQDIQSGLYNKCGDPNKNWEKWEERCKQLLNQRGILGNNNKRLKKLAYHDEEFRDSALILIGSELYTAYTHNEALQKFLNEHDIEREYSDDDICRTNVEDEMSMNEKLDYLPFACMHIVNNDGDSGEEQSIYIEPETVQNIDIDSVVKIVKSNFPDYKIYKDDEDVDYFEYDKYELLANKNNRLLKKTAYHDQDCRNFAVIYIGDKFYKGNSHNEAFEKYLNDNNINRNYSNEDNYRENVDMELENNEDLDQLPFACMHQIHKDMFDIALDKYMNENSFINFNTYRNRITKNKRQGAIFLEVETVKNIDLNQLLEAIKKEFPGYEIYTEDIKYEPFEYERYEKLARLKKAFHDTNDRECAIVYIDGQFFEGETHNEALTKFTESLKLMREYNGEAPNRDYLDMEMEKNRVLNNLPFCCLNKVLRNEITNEQVKYIYIEGYSAMNVTIDEVVNAVEKAYPGFDIFLDDYNIHPLEYEKFEKLN